MRVSNVYGLEKLLTKVNYMSIMRTEVKKDHVVLDDVSGVLTVFHQLEITVDSFIH